MDSNELVNAWLLRQFRDNEPLIGVKPGVVDSHRHLVGCPSTRVVSCEHGWECQCYSEYTREDVWRVAARFECEHGTGANWERGAMVRSVPELIAAIRAADLENFECPMEEE